MPGSFANRVLIQNRRVDYILFSLHEQTTIIPFPVTEPKDKQDRGQENKELA
jgi:hypothetical protein